jgi:hypothetical protein
MPHDKHGGGSPGHSFSGEDIVCGRMPSAGMLRCVALVTTEVSEECIAFIIRVTRIGELGTTLAITSICSQRTSVVSYCSCYS